MPPEEPLVGTGDIQSLEDLSNSSDIVRSIIPFPFGRSSLAGRLVVIALLLLPLALTMFSLRDLVIRLVKIVLGRRPSRLPGLPSDSPAQNLVGRDEVRLLLRHETPRGCRGVSVNSKPSMSSRGM